jgi:hypothetical protein
MAQRLAGRPVSVGGPTIAEGIAVRDIGELFGAEVVDVGTRHIVFQLTSWSRRIEAFITALEPFVSQATVTHIRRMAAAAPKAGKAPPPAVHGPPPQITATLRPHQQEGLRWLSHMFHSGVNAILADEMVRLRHRIVARGWAMSPVV